MKYRNGDIPESALVIFKRGHNSRDGDFYWGLPPSTYRKHLALLARALKRTGRTLSPSDGWSTYRPYAAQVAARKVYGNGAAVPRTSSHGGFWEGHDTAAVDYGNWEWVYAKFGARARDEFYADCRAVGLTPGMISKARGYPDEPWHVIDLDPWAAVTSGAITTPTSMEDDMPTMNEFLNTAAYTGGPTISEVLKALDRNLAPALVDMIWGRTVNRGLDSQGQPQMVPAIQELADAKTLLMALVARDGVDVDEGKLAAALAPLLTANLGALSDADVQRIATASADEQAKRLKD